MADERICRGAYTPMHTKKSGNIHRSVIRDKDLLAGKLSVWRASKVAGSDIEEIENILRRVGPNDNTLLSVLFAEAKEIRDIAVKDGSRRAFCVLDECNTDDDGGSHPAHAHIAICSDLGSEFKEKSSPEYISLREQLFLLFQQNYRAASK